MQSWLLWNMIGLFPIPAQTTFLIHSPWFEHLSIDLGSGKTLVVNSTGGNKDTAIHVQSLKVNGQEWRKTWLTWDDVFAEGGTMEFVLGPEPISEWFDAADLPPSPASAVGPASANLEIEVIETVEVRESQPEEVVASSNGEALPRVKSKVGKNICGGCLLPSLLGLLLAIGFSSIVF
jgi:Glycosyl hydrolase family 92